MRLRWVALAAVLAMTTGCDGGDDGPTRTDRGPAGDVALVPGVQLQADAAALSPSGDRIAVPCESRLCVWATGTGRLLSELDGGDVVAWTADGTGLVTNDGAEVVLIDASSGQVTRLGSHDSPEVTDDADRTVWDVAVSPDGSTIASAGRDGKVLVWTDGSAQATIDPGGEWATHLAFSPDGTLLAVTTPDAPAEIWDVAARRRTAALGPEPQGPVAWSPDGKTLATATHAPGEDARVSLWETSGSALPTYLTADVAGLAFAPDGSSIAVAQKDDPEVLLWQLAGAPQRLAGRSEASRSAVWSPDGARLYTVAVTEGVRRQDLPDGAPGAPFELPAADTTP